MKKIIIIFFAFLFISISSYANEIEKTSKDNINWSSYMQNVEYKIKKNWRPTQNVKSKRIVFMLVIGKQGQLISAKIIQSSGMKKADDNALASVKASAPFEPLPASYKGDSVPIEFTLDYNVVKNSEQYITSNSSFDKICKRVILRKIEELDSFKQNIEEFQKRCESMKMFSERKKLNEGLRIDVSFILNRNRTPQDIEIIGSEYISEELLKDIENIIINNVNFKAYIKESENSNKPGYIKELIKVGFTIRLSYNGFKVMTY